MMVIDSREAHKRAEPLRNQASKRRKVGAFTAKGRAALIASGDT